MTIHFLARLSWLVAAIAALVSPPAASNPYPVMPLTGASSMDYMAFGASPQGFSVSGGTLYFAAYGPIGGPELWKTDGTEAGTVLVKDIVPGPKSSNPNKLTDVAGTLFFFTGDRGLWKSDGTEAGTILVSDVALPYSPMSEMPRPTAALASGTFFFMGTDGVAGQELWKSDGTSAGTARIKDIVPGPVGVIINRIMASGSHVFFDAGNALWRSDGTEAGTILLKQFSEPPLTNAVELGGTVYFAGNDGVTGNELWKSDGTIGGTVQVKDIAPLGPSGLPSRGGLLASGGAVYFVANDGSTGAELWRSDGTAAGTSLVKDIAAGPAGSIAQPSFVSLNAEIGWRSFPS